MVESQQYWLFSLVFSLGLTYGTMAASQSATAASAQNNSGDKKAEKPDQGGALRQANLTAAKGDYDKAVKLYEQALREDPGNAFAHHMFGRVYALQGKADKAVEQYNKAIELEASNAELWNDLGVILATTGDLHESARCLKSAVKCNPMFIAAHTNLGVTLLHIGDFDGAIHALRDSLRLQPSNAQVKTKLQEALKFAAQEKAAELSDDYISETQRKKSIEVKEKITPAAEYTADDEDVEQLSTGDVVHVHDPDDQDDPAADNADQAGK